ncbi:hypothetical protein [Paenibacillus roseipurpureus]|uniref:Uncharacterized protein n=1 Tax=Paenibacillus roseopurpureus TaxID=2918901 RepID=A0AA96RIZ0_9BACL|nr:hypothetical protein [Paenibacillus sp. MBLB1832]WNR42754.1 hypothetical protein MJB10_16695 [Paenibacillus sp. MBLB1832]
MEASARRLGLADSSSLNFNMQAAFIFLGIDKAVFAEQVQAGKSFAEITKDHGISRQKLVDTLMSDFTAKIDDVKAKGDITQKQTDQKKQARTPLLPLHPQF